MSTMDDLPDTGTELIENIVEKAVEDVVMTPAEALPEPEIPVSRIDLNALWVVRRLRAKGFEAYLTGGCVRDLLLDMKPKDFDVATSAKPEEVRQIFRNCRLIGRRFLLAHVYFPGGKIIETATFRANPTDLQDDLPPDLLVTQDNVYGNAQEDAFRRDLTINGLFYDPIEGKVIDYVGGRADLEARLVRTIGDPEIRFQEDPVRIIRAIKFATRLGFEIEAKTAEAMRTHVGAISRCAPARVQEEIHKLLVSGHAQGSMSLCREIGLLDVLMPELTDILNRTPDEGGFDVNAYWSQLLKGLDQVRERNANISVAVALSALLLPAYALLEQSGGGERHWVDKLCINWAERLRLARRDQDRIRSLLSTVQLFAPDRFSGSAAQQLVKKPWFREALLLYILYLLAKGESLEHVGQWKALAHEMAKPYKQDRHDERRNVNMHFRRRRRPQNA